MHAFSYSKRSKLISYETQRQKAYLLRRAPKEDSYQPAHPRSLINFFVVRMKKNAYLAIQLSKCACIVKILIRLQKCAVLSESSMFTHIRRYVFWRYGFYIVLIRFFLPVQEWIELKNVNIYIWAMAQENDPYEKMRTTKSCSACGYSSCLSINSIVSKCFSKWIMTGHIRLCRHAVRLVWVFVVRICDPNTLSC